MCVFCRGCAAQHEAEHVSSIDSNGSGGGGGDGIPCLRCKKVRTTPLAELLPSLPHIDAAAAAAARSSKPTPIPPPACGICEDEQATKFCGDCKISQQMMCDGCHTFTHKSAKKQGHTSVPIQEYLQQGSSALSGKPLAKPMCTKHAGQPLQVFCNNCGTLVCATCGILEHNGHDLKAMEHVSGEHRDAVAAEVARTVVTRDEVVAAKTGLEGVRDQVQRNGKAAKEKVNLGFRQVMAEGKKQRDALMAKVDDAVRFKCGLLDAQVTGADDSSDNATDGIELADATLKLASPTQVLQYQKVLVGGLQRFQNHGLVLKQACGPLVDVTFGDALADVVKQIGLLGVV
eukprot:gene33104-biopygen25706